jgi:hypothetical protein
MQRFLSRTHDVLGGKSREVTEDGWVLLRKWNDDMVGGRCGETWTGMYLGGMGTVWGVTYIPMHKRNEIRRSHRCLLPSLAASPPPVTGRSIIYQND